MACYRITLQGQTFEVEILGDPHQAQVPVRVDGQELVVSIEPVSPSHRPDPLATAPSLLVATDRPVLPAKAGEGSLRSPLPGTIIQLMVVPGQVVAKGEELLVIEAMKMNNRIRSPRNGRIGQVFFKVGQPVSHGAVLLTWAE